MTTIIVGTDLSDNALEATRWAFESARLRGDEDGESTDVVVTHVVSERDMKMRRNIAGHSQHRERRRIGDDLDDWLRDVDTDGVEFDTEILVGRPARSLAAVADDRDADLLVVGQSGKGRLKRLVLGSTAEHLALRPPCPLAIIHPDSLPFDDDLRVLSATDLGASSIRSLGLGADLVRRHRGHLHILHVISLPQGTIPSVEGLDGLPDGLDEHVDETRRFARDELDAMLADQSISIDDLSPDIEIRPGYPIHEILETIDDTDADILTLGSHGRSRIAEWMLGGIGRSLLKKAPCTKILTPPDQTPDQPDDTN